MRRGEKWSRGRSGKGKKGEKGQGIGYREIRADSESKARLEEVHKKKAEV